jgi:hypothetical protein
MSECVFQERGTDVCAQSLVRGSYGAHIELRRDYLGRGGWDFVKDCRRRLLQCDDAAAATGERASESAIE